MERAAVAQEKRVLEMTGDAIGRRDLPSLQVWPAPVCCPGAVRPMCLCAAVCREAGGRHGLRHYAAARRDRER